jgi:acetate kinase
MAAIRRGRSIDTTMGMSPTGGLMMGTRSGDLDPGALVYLMDQEKWAARGVERFVNHECGLLGVSGTTSNMQLLLAAREHDARAQLAVELFVYTAAKTIGALTAALGGLRTLVFTGGIGVHSPVVREEIARRLTFLGVAIDAAKNLANAPVISPTGSACAVHVIETDEEWMIARHVERCLAGTSNLAAPSDGTL